MTTPKLIHQLLPKFVIHIYHKAKFYLDQNLIIAFLHIGDLSSCVFSVTFRILILFLHSPDTDYASAKR